MKQSIVKSFLIALLLFGNTIYAQTIDKSWADQINQTFEGLDKDKIPHGLLKDYAMEFVELNGYDGVLTKENYIHKGTFTSIYNTLLMARVNTNDRTFVNPTIFRENWYKEHERNLITLSGLYYKYSQFKEKAHTEELITITNDKLYDKYVNGVWQNPYEERQVFAITPNVAKYKGLEVAVKLPQNLFYTNQLSEVNQISIDFGDGKGYVPMPLGTTKYILYDKEGIYEWKYLLELNDGGKLFSHSIIHIEKPLYSNTIADFRTPTEACTDGVGIDRVEFSGTQPYAGQANNAILEIDYANNDCVIRRPLIVAEGFDSGLLGSVNGLGDNDYQNFILDAISVTGQLGYEIKNYDIIYVNWNDGRDYLQRNALLLEDIITYVNAEKEGNEPNVVLGQSMGGVIARYALADMEQRGLDHDTSLYISHDAPHQGANLPLGISYFARHMVDQFVSTPVGGININPSSGGSVSIEDIETLINAPGTQQLLIYSVDAGFNVNNSLHNAWQEELQQKGYPQLTRNIAISNASHCAFPQDFNPSDLLFSLDGYARTTVLTDFLLEALGPLSDLGFIIVAVAFKEPSLLLGILPGNSKFGLSFWAKALPDVGQSDQIYKGRITYTKKLFWLFNITVNLTNKAFDNPSGSLPYDYYPGGKYTVPFEFQDTVVDNWFIQFGLSSYVTSGFNFIPSVSALDVGSGATNLYNSDYLNVYTAVNPPTGNKEIPFDNFITGYENNNSLNEAHISFNTRNGNWLAKELDQVIDNEDLFDCTFACSNAEITGVTRICDGSTGYSVPNGADSYLWNVIGSNIVTIDSASLNTNSLSISRNGSNSGWISVSVRISSAKCGVDDLVLVKSVYVGAPTVGSIQYTDTYSNGNPINSDPELPNSGPELPANPTLVTGGGSGGCEVLAELVYTPGVNEITDIEWQKVTSSISWSRDITDHSGRYAYIYPTCNKPFTFKVRTKSDCGGWSQWQEFTYNITSCNSDCGSTTDNGITSDNFSLYPVPVTNDILNIKIVDDYTWNFPPSQSTPILIGDPDTSPVDPGTGGGNTSNPNDPYTHNSLNLNLSFFNNLGTLVLSSTTTGIPAEINVGLLPAGNYLLVIEYQGQTESHNIIIN